MSDTLFPERALSFSPALASTLGLEEAVMLQGLQEIALHSMGGDWHHCDKSRFERLFPFWQAADIERISRSLLDKGVIQLRNDAYTQAQHLYFCLKASGSAASASVAAASQQTSTQQATARQSVSTQVQTHDAPAPSAISTARQVQASPNTRANPVSLANSQKQALEPQWQPDKDTLMQLQRLGVSSEFIAQQLPEFVSYWRQRGDTAYAWGNKFMRQVIQEWRRKQAAEHREAPMERGWRPSEDAMELLLRIDINREFIEDAVPEFVLYWRERGDGQATWNSKFVAHVKTQWARFNATLQHDKEPRAISPHWQPSNDVYDILGMANIDRKFATEQLAEFVLYWLDSNQLHASWNTKFLQHVKYRWARQHEYDTGGTHAGRQNGSAAGAAGAKDTPFERLTDRSWANGL